MPFILYLTKLAQVLASYMQATPRQDAFRRLLRQGMNFQHLPVGVQQHVP